MKLSLGIQQLSARNIEDSISKKILLANTNQKVDTKNTGFALPSDPIYFQNSSKNSIANGRFSADIRYRNNLSQSALNTIYHRNNLLLFAENNEIKKALTAIENEIVVMEKKDIKYPLFPSINLTLVPQEKQDTAQAIQKYLDNIFYPKLMHILGWKKGAKIRKTLREYLVCGKLAYEIVYDNIAKPKEIVNIIPLDTTELSKIKEGDYLYYIQKPLDGSKERILHENQVCLVEWNENDYGYLSYVEKLKRSFNIMRGMQTSKILWFAIKSQVRMHIKLAMGDVSRQEAITRLNDSKDDFTNEFYFDDDTGELSLNSEPATVGYKEFFTAETSGSGSPEIEEVNSNGPDLTEVDSLQFWEKMYWKDTDIPYDRIDPSSQDTWSFVDVTNLKKTETAFAKFIQTFRDPIEEILLKIITIQLTLKEVEIGVDLALLDSIIIEWVAFNQYDKLNELEVMNKKMEIVSTMVAFGLQTDSLGRERRSIPIWWAIENYLDFSQDQLASLKAYRIKEEIDLGFLDEQGNEIDPMEAMAEMEGEEEEIDSNIGDENFNFEESAEDIREFENAQY